MDVGIGRSLVEEGSHAQLGNVQNVDDRNAMSVGLPNGRLDVQKNGVGVPKWKLATCKMVVLKINYQRCLFSKLVSFRTHS